MDDVSAESSGNSELEWPRTKQEIDDFLRRASANVRWLRAWGHLRMRPATSMVSRDQALELAREVADLLGRDIRDVVDLAELTAKGVRTPCLYNVDPSDCWIAYLAHDIHVLGPSDIVLIEKATGAVRYIGSANDEG